MKYVSLENLVNLIKVSPEDILIVVSEIRSHVKSHLYVREKQLYFSEKAVVMVIRYLESKGQALKKRSSELIGRRAAMTSGNGGTSSVDLNSGKNEKSLSHYEAEREKLLNMLENSNRELFNTKRELVDMKNQILALKDEITLLLLENHRLLDGESDNRFSPEKKAAIRNLSKTLKPRIA